MIKIELTDPVAAAAHYTVGEKISWIAKIWGYTPVGYLAKKITSSTSFIEIIENQFGITDVISKVNKLFTELFGNGNVVFQASGPTIIFDIKNLQGALIHLGKLNESEILKQIKDLGIGNLENNDVFKFFEEHPKLSEIVSKAGSLTVLVGVLAAQLFGYNVQKELENALYKLIKPKLDTYIGSNNYEISITEQRKAA